MAQVLFLHHPPESLGLYRGMCPFILKTGFKLAVYFSWLAQCCCNSEDIELLKIGDQELVGGGAEEGAWKDNAACGTKVFRGLEGKMRKKGRVI